MEFIRVPKKEIDEVKRRFLSNGFGVGKERKDGDEDYILLPVFLVIPLEKEEAKCE